MKTGGEHRVALSERAVAILTRQRADHPDSRFVFPRRNSRGPVPTRTVWALCKGLGDTTVHGSGVAKPGPPRRPPTRAIFLSWRWRTPCSAVITACALTSCACDAPCWKTGRATVPHPHRPARTRSFRCGAAMAKRGRKVKVLPRSKRPGNTCAFANTTTQTRKLWLRCALTWKTCCRSLMRGTPKHCSKPPSI